MATQHRPHHDDDIKGMDIVKATRKPTSMDQFKALLAHNTLVTFRDPSVFIFGALIPFIMVGTAIGIVSWFLLCPVLIHAAIHGDPS